MTPDLVEDILEAMRFHPSVEAWDEPGTIVSMTTANGPCGRKHPRRGGEDLTKVGHFPLIGKSRSRSWYNDGREKASS